MQQGKRRYENVDILMAKAAYLYARYVLQLSDKDSKTLVKVQMRIKKPYMSPNSVEMYCDDVELIETAVVSRRFDKATLQEIVKTINGFEVRRPKKK